MKNFSFFYNIGSAITLDGAVAKRGKKLALQDLSLKSNLALVVNNTTQTIEWMGTSAELPSHYKNNFEKEIDLKGKVLSPGLIDSHTHLVFSGSRSKEYLMRLSGATYEEIAASGGGINFTSLATNADSEENLNLLAEQRIQKLIELGIVACEIKTGYALTLEGELKLLKIVDKLKKKFSPKINIHRTLMSAHAIPKDISKEQYISQVILPSIDQAAALGIVDSVDAFHEQNYFSTADVQLIFERAKKHQLTLKLHVDEFNNNQGAKLGASYNCLSVDHLLHTDVDGAKALAESQTIATLLPGTAFFLGKKLANAKMLIEAGCAVAIGSDFNPGSCNFNDVFQIARMSAPSLGLNPAAIWCAITFNAAQALGLKNFGAIKTNFSSKLLVWDTTNPDDLLYDWTSRPTCHVI